MTSGLALFEKNQKDLESVISACSIEKLVDMSQIGRTIALATGIGQLRRLLTDEIVRDVFMPLQSSTLGFRTDKDKKPKDAAQDWKPGYPIYTVRDVTIEAFIRGLNMTGNEINIIAWNMYVAKNGVARKLREWPGMNGLVIIPGSITPSQDGKSARVAMYADWSLKGERMSMRREAIRSSDGKSLELDTRIQVKTNGADDSADFIIGKAMRKMQAAILDQLSSGTMAMPIGDIMDTDGIVVEPTREPVPAEQEGKRVASTSLAMQGNDRS